MTTHNGATGNATPRPWYACPLGDGGGVNQVRAVDGSPIALCSTRLNRFGHSAEEDAANTRLIVEAVNSHDALKADNERLKKALRGLVQCWDHAGAAYGDDDLSGTRAARKFVNDIGYTPAGSRNGSLIEKARAALGGGA